jgi:hypothetical protein
VKGCFQWCITWHLTAMMHLILYREFYKSLSGNQKF